MLWSGAGPVSEAPHRASATDDFPNLSSLMRLAGVFVPSIAAGEVTADAVSSIEIWDRSFGSRTWNTSVSIMFLGSTLNEYCTVLNIEDAGKSRRIRTQSAVELSDATCAAPVRRKSTFP